MTWSLPEDYVERGDKHVAFRVEEAHFPVSAILAASLRFIDRCYVPIERTAPGELRVVLVARDQVEAPGVWDALVQEFQDELTGAALRTAVEKDNREILERVTAIAMTGAPWEASSKEESFDMEDPLGIAMSWEEKHGKDANPDAQP